MPCNSKRKFFHFNEKIKLICVLVLSVASLGLFEIGHRYALSEPQLLPNLDFRHGGKYWTGTPDGIRVVPGPPATVIVKNVSQHQTLMTQSLHNVQRLKNVRVTVDLKLDGITPGTAWWQKAGVLVLSYDRTGKRMTYWPSEVGFLSGTQPWRRYEAIIPVSQAMDKMQLFVLHGGIDGTLRLRNLQVAAVQEAGWFTGAETGILALWAVVGIWILLPLIIRHRTSPVAYLALACFIGNLGLSVLPQPLLSTSSKPAFEKIAALTAPAEKETQPADADGKSARKSGATPGTEASKPKTDETGESAETGETVRADRASLLIKGDLGQYAAHFATHFILSLLVGLAFKAAGWWRLVLFVSLAATTNELLQIFVITRSATLADGFANVAGAVFGLFIVFTLHRAWRRRTA